MLKVRETFEPYSESHDEEVVRNGKSVGYLEKHTVIGLSRVVRLLGASGQDVEPRMVIAPSETLASHEQLNAAMRQASAKVLRSRKLPPTALTSDYASMEQLQQPGREIEAKTHFALEVPVLFLAAQAVRQRLGAEGSKVYLDEGATGEVLGEVPTLIVNQATPTGKLAHSTFDAVYPEGIKTAERAFNKGLSPVLAYHQVYEVLKYGVEHFLA